MVNSKNLKNPKLITTIVESEEYTRLRNNLGHRNFTDWLREQMKQYNEGIEIEKNLTAPSNGAIKTSSLGSYNTTLDKYIPNWIIDHRNHKRQNDIQDKLSYDEQLLVITATREIYNIWKGRLPKRVMRF